MALTIARLKFVSWHTVFIDKITLYYDWRPSIFILDDKICVNLMFYHIIKYPRGIFCTIQSCDRIGIPAHISKYHHHVAACAAHIKSNGNHFTIPYQYVQTNQSGTNAYIIHCKHLL